MSKNVTISWGIPAERESGLPLDPADIASAEVSMGFQGAPIDVIGTVPGSQLSFAAGDIEVGKYAVEVVLIDTRGVRSAPGTALFEVPDESAPKAAVNVTVTFQ